MAGVGREVGVGAEAEGGAGAKGCRHVRLHARSRCIDKLATAANNAVAYANCTSTTVAWRTDGISYFNHPREYECICLQPPPKLNIDLILYVILFAESIGSGIE